MCTHTHRVINVSASWIHLSGVSAAALMCWCVCVCVFVPAFGEHMRVLACIGTFFKTTLKKTTKTNSGLDLETQSLQMFKKEGHTIWCIFLATLR